MFLQLIANGLFGGFNIALPAIGLTLIFAVLRFPTFALAAHVTVGAYAGYVMNAVLGQSVVVAGFASFVIAGAVGIVTDEMAVKPLRGRSSLSIAIVTIALGLILENVIRFTFGNDLRGFDLPIFRDASYGGVRVGIQQLINLGVALLIMALVFGFLAFSRMGKAMRAVADNAPLAALRGIDTDRIRRIAVCLGMGLAGLGGMLIAIDTSVDPLLGTRTLLPVFAAAILGGLGSIPGALMGALIIGVLTQLSLLVVSATYSGAVSFFVLLIILSLRPQGVLGERSIAGIR
ncbi:branched-chain amino acid ABC transporter permease [Mesorhizobium sp. M8A.F.Ca.ET.173.01.1.1]|nr:branched-chain amino acid ABC transporter permease [Mesorhizobium sp. M8A.F.Ca.ET.173.01.1.1]